MTDRADALTAAQETIQNAVEGIPNPPDGTWAALAEVSEALEDARLWRALMQTARFRVQGSAGLNSDGTLDADNDRGYIHFGMEVWSAYKTDENTETANAIGRAMLTSLAEMNMRGSDAATQAAAQEIDEDQRMYGRAVMLGDEIRDIIRALPGQSLAEAIQQSRRPGLDIQRTFGYLRMKGLVIGALPTQVSLSRVGEEMRTFLVEKFDEAEWEEAQAAEMARSDI